MNHTVDAAQIYECTVAGQGLDFALVGLADFGSFPESFLCSVLFSLQNSLDGADSPSAVFVDFQNDETLGGLYQRIHLCTSRQTALRCRNEYANAGIVDDNAALDRCTDSAFQNSFLILGLDDFLKALHLVDLLLGQGNDTFLIVDLGNNQIQNIADSDNVRRLLGCIVCQFAARNITGVLGADIDDRFRIVDRANGTLYLLSRMYFFEGLIQSFCEVDILLHGVVIHDFSHSLLNLLNDMCRCGRAGGNADLLGVTKV